MLTRTEVADLLHRYPDVSSGETAQILTFLRKGRHLDVGLLTGDVPLRPKLDRFMADHAAQFRPGWGETAVLLAGIAGAFAAFAFLWEKLGPAVAAG